MPGRRTSCSTAVALLAEGVDRNSRVIYNLNQSYSVALLAEGVDRNSTTPRFCTPREGRPPRGGRG